MAERVYRLRRAYRKALTCVDRFHTSVRQFNLALQYPALFLDNAYISRTAMVLAEDGSHLSIVGSHIGPGVVLRAAAGATLTIRDAYIGHNSVIVASDRVTIGAGCQIAEMVVIRDQDHVYGPGQKVASAGMQSSPISIGENVWIGAKATVLRGVTIGHDAVVAASAVVRTDIEPGALYGGVPARLIRPSKPDR